MPNSVSESDICPLTLTIRACPDIDLGTPLTAPVIALVGDRMKVYSEPGDIARAFLYLLSKPVNGQALYTVGDRAYETEQRWEDLKPQLLGQEPYQELLEGCRAIEEVDFLPFQHPDCKVNPIPGCSIHQEPGHTKLFLTLDESSLGHYIGCLRCAWLIRDSRCLYSKVFSKFYSRCVLSRVVWPRFKTVHV